MNSSLPSAAVLTPSFNYGRFIGDAVESVRRQDRVNIFHVIQDAKSSDDTAERLRSYPDVDFVSQQDEGQSHALNLALQRANSDVVGWLNADEFYMPDALEVAQTEFAKG